MAVFGIPGIGSSFSSSFMMQLLVAGGSSPMGMPGMNFGFGLDGFNASSELFDRGCGHNHGVPSFLMGNQFGFGGGQGMLSMGGGGFPGRGGFGGGFPGMSNFGGFPGMNGMGFGSPFGGGGGPQQMMMMMGMLMGMMMRMMQQQQGQQCGRGQGCPIHGGANPVNMGQPGMGGGVHELQKGQSFTTQGGATINWQGDEIKVQEPGGGGRSMGGAHGTGGPSQGAFSMAGQFGPQGFSMAMAAAFAGGGGNPCGCHAAQQNAQPRDWKVWGDPHIQNPDGSKDDYTRNGGLFTLQDGTRVMMEADGPGAVVKRVLIFDPGSQLGGFDANKTTNYGDGANGKFQNLGSVADTLGQGGFQSPFGNQMGFPMFGF